MNRKLLFILSIILFCQFKTIAQCSNFKLITTGGNYYSGEFWRPTLAIGEDGTLWGWGLNSSGQLGNGSYNYVENPTQIGSDNDWKYVQTAGDYTWALKNDGSLWRWGKNGYLYCCYSGAGIKTPLRFGTRNDWKAISVGSSNVAAISNDNKLYTWGSNENFSLGVGSNNTYLTNEEPQEIGIGKQWLDVFVGSGHTFAITSDGTLYGAGVNHTNQMPGVLDLEKYSLTKIDTEIKFKNIKAGYTSPSGIDLDNNIYWWGSGNYTNSSNTIDQNNKFNFGNNVLWKQIVSIDPIQFVGTKLLGLDGQLYFAKITKENNEFIFKMVPQFENKKWKFITPFVALNGQSFYDIHYDLGIDIYGKAYKILSQKLPTDTYNNLYYSLEKFDPTFKSISLVNASKKVAHVDSYEYYDNGCENLICKIENYSNQNQSTDNITSKVWIDNNQQTGFVKRHYQIYSELDNDKANGKITLYFTQAEFNAFNIDKENKLPYQSSDNWGKANLRIKYIPLSTLEPNSVSFDSPNFNIINPTDSEIIFNSACNCWEITFLTTGFGAYFVTNNDIAIRNDCYYFKNIFTNSGAYNVIGQKEDGTLWEITENPIMISDINDWVDFSFGDHYMGMDKNGQLWAWGSNNYGQLGDGTTNYSNVPIPIGLPNQWKKFSAGFEFSIAIDNQNKLWTWGRNEISSYTNFDYSSSPRLLEGTLNWQTVDAGILRPVATTADNLGWQWGYALTNFPVLIDANLRWKVLKSGNLHLLGITTDGKAWGKGDNEYGQLGIGSNISTSVPIQIGNLTNWVDISPGRTFGLGKTSDNKYWGWGYNYEGTVGNGTTTQTLSPEYISNKFIKIGGANKQSFALDSLGDIWVWGYSNTNIIIPKPYRISNKIKPRVLPVSNVGFTNNNLGLINYLGDCDNLISKIILSRNENIDINSKVWVNPNLPFNYLNRHYELSSSNSFDNSSKIATLYFTNEEFLNYNSKNTRKLPISNSDIVGISNVRLKSFNANSSDNSGSPFSYNLTSRIINPIDTDIFWNSAENRWEISFDLENFGGYFLGTFTQCTTTKSGNWSDPAVWSCGVVPTNLDDVIISPTHNITMPDNYTGQANNLENNGNLIFGQNATLNLTGQ